MADSSTSLEELDNLKLRCHRLQEDLDEAKSAAMIAQCTAENEVAVEQRKCQEELATLQHLMKEEVMHAAKQTGDRYEGEIHRLKKLTEKLEMEKQHYRKLYERQLEESEIIRGNRGIDALLSPGVFSSVTKSLAKRVPTLNPPALESRSPSASTSANSSMQDEESLEESMKKAQEDSALLKSLVLPLEEEIDALKEKIRQQDALLCSHDSQQVFQLYTSDLVAPLLQGRDVHEVVAELDEKMSAILKSSDATMASRPNQELLLAILTTQKATLAGNVDRLRLHLCELKMMLENERREHRELRRTWQRANDQFLSAQRSQLGESRRIRSILSVDQLAKLEELRRVEEAADISAEEDSVESPDHPNTGQGSAVLNVETIVEESDTESADTIGEESSDGELAVISGEADSTSVDVASETAALLPEREVSKPWLETRTSSEENGAQEDSCAMSLRAQEGRRVVSEGEWQRLWQELRRVQPLGTGVCHTCSDAQGKVREVQGQLREAEKKGEVMQKAMERQQEDLKRETDYRQVSEERWRAAAEEYEKRIGEVHRFVETATQQHTETVAKWREIVTNVQDRLRSLTKDREAAQKELTRLQEENDSLVGKRSQHSEEMQNEIINLPEKVDDMQLLLLRYREDVIAAKVAKEHTEQKLYSKIRLLNDQLLAEQHEKAAITVRLSEEITELREKLVEFENAEEQVKMELKKRVAMDSMTREAEEKHNKTRQINEALKNQLGEQVQLRQRLETEVGELKNRVMSLQRDLGTSEAVQRDFVRLSQSLQVQLEKIRQSDKEVRWQHEEDVDECGSCRHRFSSVGRRKHHCRHCGKIFCADCVTKVVTSGPQSRQSKVCDVCHTLLVQDATPYFSTEVSHSPV